mgnify:FL=1
MQKNFYIIIAVVIIIVASAWLLMYNNLQQVKVEIKNNNSLPLPVGKEVVLAIESGNESQKTITSEFKEGMTAFDLLQTGVEKLSLELKTKNYDMGIFIEAIGDKENGQEGKYWLYYVNGEMPIVSADKMILKSGDKVEFKFEKSPF